MKVFFSVFLYVEQSNPLQKETQWYLDLNTLGGETGCKLGLQRYRCVGVQQLDKSKMWREKSKEKVWTKHVSNKVKKKIIRNPVSNEVWYYPSPCHWTDCLPIQHTRACIILCCSSLGEVCCDCSPARACVGLCHDKGRSFAAFALWEYKPFWKK